MGFLKLLQKKKKDVGVCIPEHAKKKIKAGFEKGINNSELINDLESKYLDYGIPRFEVTGVYAVRDTNAVNGRVLSGTVRAGAKSTFFGKEVKVLEVQKKGKKVKSLKFGEHGSLFLSCKSCLAKIGDVIEFS